MPREPWVLRSACPTDRGGGQCIRDEETLTHHTATAGSFDDGPRLSRADEDEVSMMRGTLTVAAACSQRIGGLPAAAADIAAAGVRYTTAGALRAAGFAVIHTCTRKGEAYGHVSVVWPPADPLNVQERHWPPATRQAFTACFTGREDS